MSKKNKNSSFRILAKGIWRNRFNIIKYYPKLFRMAHHLDKYSEEEKYSLGMTIVDVVLKACNVEVEAYGTENIPAENGIFLCSNHQEKLDPLLIWKTFPRELGVVVNDKACHRPFIKEFVKIVKSHKLIQRSMKTAIKTINSLTKELQAKRNYMIFPEGRYEDDFDELLPFMSGCFKSPLRSKVPILPVCLVNSYKVFDKANSGIQKMEVHYLKPIMPEEYAGLKSVDLSLMVRDRIQAAVNEKQ